MKIYINALILDLDDKPIQETLNDGTKQDVQLGKLCTNALLSMEPGEDLSGDNKVEYMGLALRIKAAMKEDTPIDLTSEEIVLLKARIAKFYNTLASARAWMLLEGK